MMGNPEICVDSEIEDELAKIKEKVPEMIYVRDSGTRIYVWTYFVVKKA